MPLRAQALELEHCSPVGDPQMRVHGRSQRRLRCASLHPGLLQCCGTEASATHAYEHMHSGGWCCKDVDNGVRETLACRCKGWHGCRSSLWACNPYNYTPVWHARTLHPEHGKSAVVSHGWTTLLGGCMLMLWWWREPPFWEYLGPHAQSAQDHSGIRVQAAARRMDLVLTVNACARASARARMHGQIHSGSISKSRCAPHGIRSHPCTSAQADPLGVL
jgi:hypothetical protein